MLARAVTRKLAQTRAPVTRMFSDKLTIPTDEEQQAGRRKTELDLAKQGTVAFNNDPIVPTFDQGTKENPILVPSGAHHRYVI